MPLKNSKYKNSSFQIDFDSARIRSYTFREVKIELRVKLIFYFHLPLEYADLLGALKLDLELVVWRIGVNNFL